MLYALLDAEKQKLSPVHHCPKQYLGSRYTQHPDLGRICLLVVIGDQLRMVFRGHKRHSGCRVCHGAYFQSTAAADYVAEFAHAGFTLQSYKRNGFPCTQIIMMQQ